jgi:hypothetical protein
VAGAVSLFRNCCFLMVGFLLALPKIPCYYFVRGEPPLTRSPPTFYRIKEAFPTTYWRRHNFIAAQP